MADNRKYYYLKLKESYFDDDSIVLLESMQDGILYSYILLKLYLKSLKHGGRLQLDESIPYTPQIIATITRQQIGTVERAIKIFLQLGLMELLIDQSSTEGERKRRARQANRLALNPGGQMSAHCPDIRPPEKEIELEIKVERELEKGHAAPTAFGRYQNVFLSAGELYELQTDFPTVWQEYIERLSEYVASTGRTYKSHAATIRRWIADDRRKAAPAVRDRDYTVRNWFTNRVSKQKKLAFPLTFQQTQKLFRRF